MVVHFWTKHAAVIGNGAQWISAAATVIAVGYAIHRAEPLFENYNLKEKNAEFEIQLRGSKEELRRAKDEILKATTELQKAKDEITRIDRDAIDARNRLRAVNIEVQCAKIPTALFLPIAMPAGPEDHFRNAAAMEKWAKTASSIKLRALFDSATDERQLTTLPIEDRESLLAEWRALRDQFSKDLDRFFVKFSSRGIADTEYMRTSVTILNRMQSELVTACQRVVFAVSSNGGVTGGNLEGNTSSRK